MNQSQRMTDGTAANCNRAATALQVYGANDSANDAFEFGGVTFATIWYGGRPCWLARDVCLALGYANGNTLTKKVRGDWADEFEEGEDFEVLVGKKLQQFKDVARTIDDSSTVLGSSLMLLYETGVHAACIKTNQPKGKQLRRFFAREVMPQLNRDGRFSPDRSVENGRLTDAQPETAAERRLRLAEAREARLSRQLEQGALKDLVKTLRQSGHIANDIITTYEIAASEVATAKDFSALKPPTHEPWESPTSIANRLGVSVQRVGKTITQLGLRGNLPGLARAIVNKAQGHDRTVTSYVYSPQAVAQIEARCG